MLIIIKIYTVIVDDSNVMRQIFQSDVWLNRPTDKWLRERSFGKELGNSIKMIDRIVIIIITIYLSFY